MSTRTKFGWIVAALGVVAAFGLFRYYYARDDSLLQINRTFVIAFLLWLAWPELARLPKWLATVVPIVAIICAWRPQLILVALPIAFVYLLLRPTPKPKKKSAEPSKSSALVVEKKNNLAKKKDGVDS